MIRFSIILLILLVSCETAPEKVLDLNDIVSTSELYKEGSEKETQIEVVDSTQFIIDNFKKNGVPVSSLSIEKLQVFPDQFGAENTVKYKIIIDSNNINYFSWTYKDSSKTTNAFFNWIDNFGEEKNSFFIGESARFQMNPFMLLVSDTTMIFIEGESNFLNSIWETYTENVGYEKNWNYFLTQRRNSKVNWFVFENNEKVIFPTN